jgi:hypothetical protein
VPQIDPVGHRELAEARMPCAIQRRCHRRSFWKETRVTNLPPFALERYFAQWEFVAPYLLCSSDIEGWRMADLLALADDEGRERWERLSLGYTEYPGLPALREAITTLYTSVTP